LQRSIKGLKEFTKDEMIDRNDELLDGPEKWMNRLTLQEQFEILTQAGYDVELAQYRCAQETEWLVEYGDIIDLSSIDMTFSYIPDNEGWDCGWRRRNAVPPAQFNAASVKLA
jgi:hypothetical protein